MTTKYNRENILKNCFFDLGALERQKQLQGWLSNVVTPAPLKSEEEALQILQAVKRVPMEKMAPPAKVSLHNVHASFFANKDQTKNKQPSDDDTPKPKKPGK